MTTLTNRQQALLAFIHDLRERYPDWTQRDLIDQMRRAFPDYNSGIWSVALPFNRGPSGMATELQERIQALREDSTREDGIDLAHILTALDVRLNFDLVDDTFVSWAGDLGSHALHLHAEGLDIPVGSADAYASLTDLLGDMDGDNIARHARPAYELEDALAYYGLAERPPGMPGVEQRYATFLADLGLLRDGEISPDAADPEQVLYARTRSFVYWEGLADSLAGHQLANLLRRALHPDGAPSLESRITTAVEQFVAILGDGLAAERAAGQSG